MPTEAELLADLKAGVAKVKILFENLWAALPADFQHDALDAAKDGVNEVSALAETEAQRAAPPTAASLIDDAIAAADAKVESEIAIIRNQGEARKAELIAAKSALSPPADNAAII